ncbi:hypothetical protein [Oceanicola sp. 502str15]|uniref:hypothetical protein n=1 Tax=Oceanicola sp. 502str15 TaxID=2696061 RepID=UPI0020945A4A|nr:hypothetical protein [Oceanicola sp. 502str15]MCO6382026.1 hypothetical protein [Oceanicola sp. 502str15]
MTKLAPLARQRRQAALAAIIRPHGDNVIAVDFRKSRRAAPVLPLDLGMRQAVLHSAANTDLLPLAA